MTIRPVTSPVIALALTLMAIPQLRADDGIELSLVPGEQRAYKMQIDETTTSAGGGVNVKDTYPTTLEISLTTESPNAKELIPVVLKVTRYQAKLPQLDADFVKRVYEFDSATWQPGTKLSELYFAYYAAHLAVPLKLLFNKTGELVEVEGTAELAAELERLLRRDFADHPAFDNAILAGRIRCHKDTLKRQWEGLLTIALPQDFEPEKPWTTKAVYPITGGYVGWIKGKHAAVEGDDGGFVLTTEYELPRTQVAVLKNASGSENEYFIKNGTGKGTLVRGGDGWATKHTRELHLYLSITLKFSGTEIPSERYSKINHTIERLAPKP